MKQFIKLTTALLVLFSLSGCEDSTMIDMEMEFDNIRVKTFKKGYTAVIKENDNEFTVSVTSEKLYKISFEVDEAKFVFTCDSKEGNSYTMDGEPVLDSADEICSDTILFDGMDDIQEGLYKSGFFNEDYDVEYIKKEDYYRAKAITEVGIEYVLKVFPDSNKIEYTETSEDKTLKITVTPK